MTKPLRHTKAGTSEVQRLLGHHLDQALKALHSDQPLTDAAVHGARKQLKKGRADLRLLRKALGAKTYTYENTALRDVARPLSAVRDARALLDTLDTLVAHSGVQGQALELDPVRQALRAEYDVVRYRVLQEDNTLETVVASLQAAQARVHRWRLPRRGWAVLGAGVGRVYRQGRQALTVVQEEPSSEQYHAWRKQVKYLWHQLQVLQPLQLGALTALAEQAHTLADALGDEHDLAVLTQTFLDAPERCPASATRQTLLDLIARRRAHLQAQALALGLQLYADTPRVFGDCLRGYWRAWRGHPAPAPSGGRQ